MVFTDAFDFLGQNVKISSACINLEPYFMLQTKKTSKLRDKRTGSGTILTECIVLGLIPAALYSGR